MSASVLKQLTTRSAVANLNATDAEGIDDLGTFGWLRGVRDHSVMLSLYKKNGSITAFSYAWLERVEFDPTEGITLRFGSFCVKIIGRNLHAEVRPSVRLVDGLCRHRVPWIQEADEPTAMAADKRAILIEAIELASG